MKTLIQRVEPNLFRHIETRYPRRVIGRVSLFVALLLAAPPAGAQGDQDTDARLRKLQERVELLEQKLAQQQPQQPQPQPPAPPPPVKAEKPKPLDVRQPPFGEFDFSWLDGSNSQPASLLTVGPLTWTIYVDAYYAFQFHQPIDHTIFPTTVAPRHNEISFNLGMLGVELTGLDGPIGRFYVQYGSNIETDAGQDATTTRGYFLSATAFKYIEQAAVGWHFHRLHGINTEVGIFPSYVGLESYLPQENWNYTHAFLSDFTPFYFFGGRIQLFPTERLKIELWLVNGWQSFGQWGEAKAGGYQLNWRPREWISLVHSLYAGQDVPNDAQAARVYTDNDIQLRYYKSNNPHKIAFAALALVADAGYQHRGAPVADGWMGGVWIANRVAWRRWIATTLRLDIFYDERGTLVQHLPAGNPYALPSNGPYLLGGVTITQDFLPSPWFIVRLEYSHRESNQPYFSGHGGVTGPDGIQGPAAPAFMPDLQNRDDRLILDATLRL